MWDGTHLYHPLSNFVHSIPDDTLISLYITFVFFTQSDTHVYGVTDLVFYSVVFMFMKHFLSLAFSDC